MEFNFDKQLLFENIAYLLKKSGKRIGEIESEAGVSPGYISRTKDDSSKPGIEFIGKVAYGLGVDIDTLLTLKLEELSSTQQYLFDVITKMQKDTEADRLDWKVFSADIFNEIPDNANPVPPLCHWQLMEYYDERWDQHGKSEHYYFKSHSFGIKTWVVSDCYNLKLKNNTQLFLMLVGNSFESNKNTPRICEIWIINAKSEDQFLCSTKDTKLAPLISKLYSTVSEFVKHPKIEKTTKNALDAFLADDLGDELDDMDFLSLLDSEPDQNANEAPVYDNGDATDNAQVLEDEGELPF